MSHFSHRKQSNLFSLILAVSLILAAGIPFLQAGEEARVLRFPAIYNDLVVFLMLVIFTQFQFLAELPED